MPILSDRYRGLAPTILVIIVVWAVVAVLMLTGTLVAAQQIDDRVNNDITVSVPEIDEDTDNVKLAARTARIAQRIVPTVDNISEQLTDVEDAAQSIDITARSILGTARIINNTVEDIHATALDINGTVNSISGTVGGIGGSVNSILVSARSIERSLAGVRRLGEQSIDPGVAAINARADSGISAVAGIDDDLVAVRGEVTDHQHPAGGLNLHGHLNSIDCKLAQVTGLQLPLVGSTLSPANLGITGRSTFCNQ